MTTDAREPEERRLETLRRMDANARIFEATREAELQRCTVIVCGGRHYLDLEWAKQHRYHVEVVVYRADWMAFGPKAGPMRNQQMIDAGGRGLIAFPGGAGTSDCVRRAVSAGIPVWRPYP